jgi:hypothetical protein
MPIPFIAIAAAIGAAGSVGGAVAGASGQAKQRLFQQNLELLSLDEKKKLEAALQGAKSEEARQKILADTLGTIGSARVDALGKLQQEKEKTKKTLLVVGIAGGVLLILTLILVNRK